MNKTKEMLEIIEGFQNLTSKIKDDHDSIKKSLKNRDLTIAACKNEYKKLYTEHEELKKKYKELETEFEQHKTKNVEKTRKRKNIASNRVNKKKIIVDYDTDAEDEKSTREDERIDENDENEDDYEIIKVKKNKKKKQIKQQKKKKVKGIIDYINNKSN